MNNQHCTQSQEMSHDAFLADVGSLLTQRVADSPSQYEAQVSSIFATYLTSRRQQLGLSQAELAQRAGATEFDIYTLEQGMLLPRQIEYRLLRELARALGEDAELLALILERDIAHVDLQDEVDFWRQLGTWYKNFLSALSTPRANAYAAGLICFVLILFGVQSFLAVPLEQRNDGQSSAQLLVADPVHTVGQRGSVKIIYANINGSWPEHGIHFVVDRQVGAIIAYIEEPMRLNRWGCDISFSNEYGPCSFS